MQNCKSVKKLQAWSECYLVVLLFIFDPSTCTPTWGMSFLVATSPTEVNAPTFGETHPLKKRSFTQLEGVSNKPPWSEVCVIWAQLGSTVLLPKGQNPKVQLSNVEFAAFDAHIRGVLKLLDFFPLLAGFRNIFKHQNQSEIKAQKKLQSMLG